MLKKLSKFPCITSYVGGKGGSSLSTTVAGNKKKAAILLKATDGVMYKICISKPTSPHNVVRIPERRTHHKENRTLDSALDTGHNYG